MDNLNKYIQKIRNQRHDFMNDIQIIYGYLQVGKNENALEYIEKISKENKIISELYSLNDEYFGFCMENNIKKLRQKGVDIEVNIELEKFYKDFFTTDYIKKFDLVNNIFNRFEKDSIRRVYIYIFEDDLGQSLLICSDESIIDELSWMECWQLTETSIDELQLYCCNYDNNIGYRITFI